MRACFSFLTMLVFDKLTGFCSFFKIFHWHTGSAKLTKCCLMFVDGPYVFSVFSFWLVAMGQQNVALGSFKHPY